MTTPRTIAVLAADVREKKESTQNRLVCGEELARRGGNTGMRVPH
jgi:hypothetical protein